MCLALTVCFGFVFYVVGFVCVFGGGVLLLFWGFFFERHSISLDHDVLLEVTF